MSDTPDQIAARVRTEMIPNPEANATGITMNIVMREGFTKLLAALRDAGLLRDEPVNRTHLVNDGRIAQQMLAEYRPTEGSD